MNKFEVTVEYFDDLSDQEKDSVPDSGPGKEYASYIRVRHLGQTILLESDAIEPEDKTFTRDLKWIAKFIESVYEIGQKDVIDKANHQE